MDINKQDRFDIVIGIVGLILWLSSIFYTFFNRDPIICLRYSIYTGCFVGLLVITLILFAWVKDGFSKPKLSTIILLPFLPAIFFIAGFSYYSVAVLIKDLFLWLVSVSQTLAGSITYTIIFCLVTGLILFFFRLKLRAMYGLVEALTGLVVAGNRVYNDFDIGIQKPTFYLAIITAGIFLVVRGLDNIHQGFTNDPKDPWAQKFYNRFLKSDTSTD